MFKKLPRWNMKSVIVVLQDGSVYNHSCDTWPRVCVSVEKDYVKVYIKQVYYFYKSELVKSIQIHC